MVAVIQKEKLVKELVLGHDYTSQLQFLLNKSSAEIDSYDDLMVKILTCFSEAISLLETATSDSVATSQVDSDDFGESKKWPFSTNNKGSYKRKKTGNSLMKVSSTVEDGHAWRKYGQKNILNAKYPRSYFRCTHKYDKGCKATKQVQRKEDDPKLYHITYIGNHTCSQILNSPPSHSQWDSYNTINSIIPASSSSCAPPTIKEDSSNNVDTTTTHHQSLDAPSMDFMPFDDHHTAPIGGLSFDNMVKSIDLYSGFQFLDESEFNYL